MRLRFLVLCDKNGVKTEPQLQYFCEEYCKWEDVKTIEYKTWEYENEGI